MYNKIAGKKGHFKGPMTTQKKKKKKKNLFELAQPLRTTQPLLQTITYCTCVDNSAKLNITE